MCWSSEGHMIQGISDDTDAELGVQLRDVGTGDGDIRATRAQNTILG